MFHSICYVSSCSENLSSSEINDILDQCKSNNSKTSIKGILIYSEGNFLQILEGEKKPIKLLFERINTDQRHQNIFKIFERQIDCPDFDSYQTEFTTILGKKFNNKKLQDFLDREYKYNRNNFKSVSYIINRFIYGNAKQAI